MQGAEGVEERLQRRAMELARKLTGGDLGGPPLDLDLGGGPLGDETAEAMAEAVSQGWLVVCSMDLRRSDVSLEAVLLLCEAFETASHKAEKPEFWWEERHPPPCWLELGENPSFEPSEALRLIRERKIRCCIPVRCGRWRCMQGAPVHLSCALRSQAAKVQAAPAGASWTVASPDIAVARPAVAPGPEHDAEAVLRPLAELAAAAAQAAQRAPAAAPPPPAPPPSLLGLAAGSVVQPPQGVPGDARAQPPLPPGPPPTPGPSALVAPPLLPAAMSPLAAASAPPVVLELRNLQKAQQRAFAVLRGGARLGGLATSPLEELEVLLAAPLAIMTTGRALVRRARAPGEVGWVDAQNLVGDACEERAFSLLASDGEEEGLIIFVERAVSRLGGRVAEAQKLRQLVARRRLGSLQELLELLHDRARREAAGICMPGDVGRQAEPEEPASAADPHHQAEADEADAAEGKVSGAASAPEQARAEDAAAAA